MFSKTTALMRASFIAAALVTGSAPALSKITTPNGPEHSFRDLEIQPPRANFNDAYVGTPGAGPDSNNSGYSGGPEGPHGDVGGRCNDCGGPSNTNDGYGDVRYTTGEKLEIKYNNSCGTANLRSQHPIQCDVLKTNVEDFYKKYPQARDGSADVRYTTGEKLEIKYNNSCGTANLRSQHPIQCDVLKTNVEDFYKKYPQARPRFQPI